MQERRADAYAVQSLGSSEGAMLSFRTHQEERQDQTSVDELQTMIDIFKLVKKIDFNFAFLPFLGTHPSDEARIQAIESL